MKTLDIYTQTVIQQIVRKRAGEIKIGEEVQVSTQPVNWEKELAESKCKFVLVGIPEDIGVRANYGRGGAHTAWKPALDSFLNQQSNVFLNGKNIFVLGNIFVNDLMDAANGLAGKTTEDIVALRHLVTELDKRVCDVMEKIIALKKIPVIVGGGHNNAFPIIKAAALALRQKINVINCDPHADFRPLEGRHSGNGFSYAWHENFLHKYSLFCMHEQYNTAEVINEFTRNNNQLYYSVYEDVFVRNRITFDKTLQQNIAFIKSSGCGVEIDLDAITNIPSSAKTSSGISPVQARQYAYQCGTQLDALYFHIAEGAPILSHIKADNKTGKLIAYLMSDFIKGVVTESLV